MTLEALKRRMKADADERAEAILAEAKERAAARNQKVLAEAEAKMVGMRSRVAEAERLAASDIARAQGEADRTIEAAKGEVVGSACDAMLDRMLARPEEDQQRLLRALLRSGRELVPGKVTVEVVDPEDMWLLAEDPEIVPGTAAAAAGGDRGFVLISEDGSRRIDLTYSGVLKRNRKETTARLMQLLYPETPSNRNVE